MKPNPGICKDCQWCKKKCSEIKPLLHPSGLYSAAGTWDYYCTRYIPANMKGLYKCSELKECVGNDFKHIGS